MNNLELADKAIAVAKNYKTLYVMGCFGAPLNDKNKNRYTHNNAYNMQASRTKMINSATADTFGFDCVCFVKGLLWGWNGNKNHIYGGAEYCSNNVPDISTEGLIGVCHDVSTDFSNIQVGEVVWLKGHVGLYVGNGLVAECTPAWKNCVQLTALANIGTKAGYNSRSWAKHGKMPFIEYKKPTPTPTPTPQPTNSLKQLDNAVTVVANEVIRGVYGSGEKRKQALGEYYRVVQDKVNKILGA